MERRHLPTPGQSLSDHCTANEAGSPEHEKFHGTDSAPSGSARTTVFAFSKREGITKSKEVRAYPLAFPAAVGPGLDRGLGPASRKVDNPRFCVSGAVGASGDDLSRPRGGGGVQALVAVSKARGHLRAEVLVDVRPVSDHP